MKEITKNTIIGDILDIDASLAPYFLEIGMHCLGMQAVHAGRGAQCASCGNGGFSVCFLWGMAI